MDLNKVKELIESCSEHSPVPSEITAGDIKRLFQITEVLSTGLWQVREANAGAFLKWQEEQEEKGNDLNEWDWFSHLAKTSLNQAQALLKDKEE